MADKKRNHAHTVYRPTRGGKLKEIDIVFAAYDDPEEMRRSLISHDGYAANIVVKCGRKRSPAQE